MVVEDKLEFLALCFLARNSGQAPQALSQFSIDSRPAFNDVLTSASWPRSAQCTQNHPADQFFGSNFAPPKRLPSSPFLLYRACRAVASMALSHRLLTMLSLSHALSITLLLLRPLRVLERTAARAPVLRPAGLRLHCFGRSA